MGRWVDSLEAEALARLPDPVRRYVRQGARDGIAASEAPEAWGRRRLLPRVLHDVTEVGVSCRLLGTEVTAPIGVAPTTMQRAAHPDGELAMAAGVAAAGGLLCVSSNAGTSFADIGATGVPWWLQMYLTQDRTLSLPVLDSAVTAGARAIVLTLDTPIVGAKYDDGPTIWETTSGEWLRANFDADVLDRPGGEKATDLGPRDIEWLGSTTGLPVVAKGVLRASDAVRCVDAGAAAVWVSNHGGRQLDRVVATADVLVGVAAGVAGRAEVYVDGGLRRGTDIVTALAMGADAAFLGRLPVYALAVDGSQGVERLLTELTADVVEALALLGCPDVDSLRAAEVVVDHPMPPRDE